MSATKNAIGKWYLEGRENGNLCVCKLDNSLQKVSCWFGVGDEDYMSSNHTWYDKTLASRIASVLISEEDIMSIKWPQYLKDDEKVVITVTPSGDYYIDDEDSVENIDWA